MDRSTDRNVGRGGIVRGTKVTYIIEHPFHAPTINDTHYVRNRRFGRDEGSCCSNAVSWGRAGRRPAIHPRPTDRQPRQIGWERLYRERERDFPLVLSIEQMLRFNEKMKVIIFGKRV